MPHPAKYKGTEKSYKQYLKDCMHQTLHKEKKDKDQAIAICLNRWRKEHGPRHPGKALKKKMALSVAMRVAAARIRDRNEKEWTVPSN